MNGLNQCVSKALYVNFKIFLKIKIEAKQKGC